MNLKNINITLNGEKYAILAEKSTPIPNRSICLLSSLNKEQDYSLWLVEISDDEKSMDLRPYEGTDIDDLKKQMLEDFIETAFNEEHQ